MALSPHQQVLSGTVLAAQGRKHRSTDTPMDTPRGCRVLESRLCIYLVPTHLTNLFFLDPNAGLESEAQAA